MRKNRAMTHRVALLALDDVVGFDLGVPPQVFGSARDAAGAPLYAVTTCSDGGAAVRSTGGYRGLPDADLTALTAADTGGVPGGHGGAATPAGTPPPPP